MRWGVLSTRLTLGSRLRISAALSNCRCAVSNSLGPAAALLATGLVIVDTNVSPDSQSSLQKVHGEANDVPVHCCDDCNHWASGALSRRALPWSMAKLAVVCMVRPMFQKLSTQIGRASCRE